MFVKDNNKQVKASANPFLDAKREWNERYGSYIARARAWQWVGLVALLLATTCVAGVIYFASQNSLIPYVVEVGNSGSVAGVYPAAQKPLSADLLSNIKRHQMAQFIQDVRGVSPDTTVQKRAIDRAFAHLSGAYPAYELVSTWFRDNHPFKRAERESVAVFVQQVVAVSDKTWRIEWTETSRLRKPGQAPLETAMIATITVLDGGKVTEENLLHNPTGLFVTDIDWQKTLGNSAATNNNEVK